MLSLSLAILSTTSPRNSLTGWTPNQSIQGICPRWWKIPPKAASLKPLVPAKERSFFTGTVQISTSILRSLMASSTRTEFISCSNCVELIERKSLFKGTFWIEGQEPGRCQRQEGGHTSPCIHEGPHRHLLKSFFWLEGSRWIHSEIHRAYLRIWRRWLLQAGWH